MKILIPFLLRWERTRVPICRSGNFRTKKFQIQRSRWGFTLSNWGEVQSPIFRVTTFRSSSHLSSSIQLQQTPQIILHLRQQKQIHYPAIYKANMSMYTYTGVRVCVYISLNFKQFSKSVQVSGINYSLIRKYERSQISVMFSERRNSFLCFLLGIFFVLRFLLLERERRLQQEKEAYWRRRDCVWLSLSARKNSVINALTRRWSFLTSRALVANLFYFFIFIFIYIFLQ